MIDTLPHEHPVLPLPGSFVCILSTSQDSRANLLQFLLRKSETPHSFQLAIRRSESLGDRIPACHDLQFQRITSIRQRNILQTGRCKRASLLLSQLPKTNIHHGCGNMNHHVHISRPNPVIQLLGNGSSPDIKICITRLLLRIRDHRHDRSCIIRNPYHLFRFRMLCNGNIRHNLLQLPLHLVYVEITDNHYRL